MKTDVLVIGGSAAGIMAAITAKKHYHKKVTLVRKEKKVLIPCGLPYTMATVDGPENNLIPDDTLTSKGIDLIIDEDELNVDALDISGVPFIWSTEVQVRRWK